MAEKTLALIVDSFYARSRETAYVIRRGYRTQRWSYRQLAESIWQLARELPARGINPGDRVLLWGEDCPEWVVSFFACVWRGAVAVPMDRTASLEFVQKVCRQSDVRLCLSSGAMPIIHPELPVLTFESYSELISRHPPLPPALPDSDSNDAAEIVFTSGTTADPKGVVLSHRNILANLDPLEQEIRKYLKFERIVHPLRFLNLLPLSHVFGQFLGLFVPQIMGSTVVFQQSLNPSEIIQTIKREKISVLISVPRVLDTIRNKLERDLASKGLFHRFQEDLHAAAGAHFIKRWWRFRSLHRQFGWKFWAFISGGASLGEESEQFWCALGFAVIQGYGLTETTSLISVNHPFRSGKGSIGQVLPGRELKLAENGEILVRGESVANSYWQGMEGHPVTRDEGWFHTGDIGALDPKGNLYFKGRSKNVVVSSEGMNIYPEDLETALRRQPEISDCVVLGLERNGHTEPCAVLIMKNAGLDPILAIKRANETLAEYQRIRNWTVWPEADFPRTSTQKPQIRAIQDIASRQVSGATVRETQGGVLTDAIMKIAGRAVGDISPHMDLTKDLNLSSIERVELLSALEDRLQIDLDESLFTSVNTIGELEKMLSQPSPRKEFRYPRWAQRMPVAYLRNAVYYLLTWPATHMLACPRILGRENLRTLRGPHLFICNHITQVDIGFILAALSPRFRHRLAVAMNGELLQEMRDPPVGTGFFKKWIDRISYGLITAFFNVFPLPQKSGYRESFAFAGESVDRGYSVLVFPEGTRTKTGEMGPFRAGIGILATTLNIPVVPLRIDGLFELKKTREKIARPGAVRVTIKPALRFEQGRDPSSLAMELEKKVRD